VPQLAEQRAEHDAGTDLVLIYRAEEIMHVANNQVPLFKEPDRLEFAEVGSDSLTVADTCLDVRFLDGWINLIACASKMRFIVNLAPHQVLNDWT
jgi:hypothetical protein